MSTVKKSVAGFIVRSLLFIAAGVLLWIYPEAFAQWIVIGLGIILFLTAIGMFALYFSDIRERSYFHWSFFCALLSALAGLGLIIWSGFFANFFMIVLGITVIALAVTQLIEIISVRKQTGISVPWLYISPVILLLLGVLVVFHPESFNNIIGYLASISLIIYGLAGFFILYHSRK